MPEATASTLQVLARGSQMREAVLAARDAGETVGFVPTMGALHEGHLSLVDAARAECDRVVTSIFVNPTQFGPNEDFHRYPRPLERDLDLLRSRACDFAFVPSADEMFPAGFETYVEPGEVARQWEGAARPGHFRGVATVVLKLFQFVLTDAAYFGRKDYQQTLVVRRMAEDLNVATSIRICPTVRESDGLALSSRNAYLTPDERRRAPALYRSLKLAEAACAAGETSAAEIRRQMSAHLDAVGGIEVEYIAIVGDGTVVESPQIAGPTVAAIAARLGRTRLIDNHRIS